MAKRELILDFSEYDLNHVVADIDEIRRYNPRASRWSNSRRFAMKTP